MNNKNKNRKIMQTEHDDTALLVPEDRQIADAEVAYGRDHDNRFAHHKRGPAEHRCTGIQCEDKEFLE